MPVDLMMYREIFGADGPRAENAFYTLRCLRDEAAKYPGRPALASLLAEKIAAYAAMRVKDFEYPCSGISPRRCISVPALAQIELSPWQTHAEAAARQREPNITLSASCGSRDRGTHLPNFRESLCHLARFWCSGLMRLSSTMSWQIIADAERKSVRERRTCPTPLRLRIERERPAHPFALPSTFELRKPPAKDNHVDVLERFAGVIRSVIITSLTSNRQEQRE